MAVETYQWATMLGSGDIEYSVTVRESEFGDGYTQTAESGINPTAIMVPMKHIGPTAEVDAIRDFLLRHVVKAFIVTPFGEEMGLYKVVKDSIRKNQVTPHVAEINFSIKRAYGVYA